MGCLQIIFSNCCKEKKKNLGDFFEDCKTDNSSQNLKTKKGNLSSQFKSSGIKPILRDNLENNKKLELANFTVKCQNCEKKKEKNKNDANINEKFKYCYECKQFFCENCWTEKHTGGNEEMQKMKEHKFFPYVKKTEKCRKHKDKEIIYYCDDCEEKCCEDDKEHENHERRSIFSFLAEVSEKEGTFDQNMLLAMIANQNRNDDSMNDYIKNAINKKFKVD